MYFKKQHMEYSIYTSRSNIWSTPYVLLEATSGALHICTYKSNIWSTPHLLIKVLSGALHMYAQKKHMEHSRIQFCSQ
jgi:hypothetical protein